jgi:hypothetical protein
MMLGDRAEERLALVFRVLSRASIAWSAYLTLMIFSKVVKTALEEAVDFYRGYDPVITWWIKKSWDTLMAKLTDLTVALRKLTGIDRASSADDIVGDPIGREALLGEIEAEWIAYTPEKLIQIAEEEFEWCEREMKKASETLGFDSPSDALEHVKNTFVEPGEQIHVSAVFCAQIWIPN